VLATFATGRAARIAADARLLAGPGRQSMIAPATMAVDPDRACPEPPHGR